MIDWFKKHRVLFALICVVILLLLMGAPVINPQKEMTIQTKSPATNETGEFTLFATMSCMDKYDGKHEYILIRAARQTPGRSPADSAESSFLGHHRLIAARRAIPASGITYPA